MEICHVRSGSQCDAVTSHNIHSVSAVRAVTNEERALKGTDRAERVIADCVLMAFPFGRLAIPEAQQPSTLGLGYHLEAHGRLLIGVQMGPGVISPGPRSPTPLKCGAMRFSAADS